MRWRLVHLRGVAGIAAAISMALACSSQDDGDGAGGAAGSSPDVHCVDLDWGCQCSADPNHEFDDAAGAPECTPPTNRNTWCCRTLDYPNGGTCECKAVGCRKIVSGCACGTDYADGPMKTCSGAGYSYCCLTATGQCTCTDQKGCLGGTVVPTCDLFRVTHCASGTRTIPSCKGDKPTGGTGGFPATGGTGGVPPTGGFGGTGATTGGGGLSSAACSSCSATNCAQESGACWASPECTELIYCMEKCPTGGHDCVQECIYGKFSWRTDLQASGQLPEQEVQRGVRPLTRLTVRRPASLDPSLE